MLLADFLYIFYFKYFINFRYRVTSVYMVN